MKRFRPRNNRGSMRRTLPANSRRPTSCRPSTCVSFRCMGSAFVKEEPEEALGEPVAMPAPPAPFVAPASAPRGAEPALIAAEEGVAAAAGSPQEEAVPAAATAAVVPAPQEGMSRTPSRLERAGLAAWECNPVASMLGANAATRAVVCTPRSTPWLAVSLNLLPACLPACLSPLQAELAALKAAPSRRSKHSRHPPPVMCRGSCWLRCWAAAPWAACLLACWPAATLPPRGPLASARRPQLAAGQPRSRTAAAVGLLRRLQRQRQRRGRGTEAGGSAATEARAVGGGAVGRHAWHLAG